MHLKKRWIDRRVYEYFAVTVAPLLKWRDPILVYQMGKVGSSSIRNSLFRCQDPRTRLVLMSHEFLPVRDRNLNGIRVDPGYRDHLMREVEHERRVYRALSWRRKLWLRFRERWYSGRIYRVYVQGSYRLRVITLVRDPVAHNVSMFFQLLDDYVETPPERAVFDIGDLITTFLERYMHSRPLIWFDAEFRTTLGIDVFEHEFPMDDGHMRMSTDRVEVLVLKCELDDAAKARAIAAFLGLDDFTITRTNVTSAKPIGKQYGEFKRRLRVPEALLDEMYESKYAKHFYSDDERARLRERWHGGASNR